MKIRPSAFLFLFLSSGYVAGAQKVFSEGIIVYNVTMESADHKVYSGTYVFTCKGNKIRKELRLNNGYQDVLLLDCGRNKAYSLRKSEGKKYAIELSLDDIRRKQEFFGGYKINNEKDNSKKIAGYAVYKGDVNYNDGSNLVLLYTKDWQPSQPITFERFPDAHFIPLSFSYTDENGMAMHFEAEKIECKPVENILFRIPPDYKMIPYSEYKQISQ